MEKKMLSISNRKEFEEFASGITRTYFMEKYLIDKTGRREFGIYESDKLLVSCPEFIELENSWECNNCFQCWKNAISNIYFKDDIEKCKLINITKENGAKIKKSITYDYDKEYTLQEILDLPIGTKILIDGFPQIYTIEEMEYKNNGLFRDDINEFTLICNVYLTSKYKLMKLEKEVSFAEVLESSGNCKCRVEHDFINDMEVHGLSEYRYFDNYMINLCDANELDNQDIKEIIKNGTWFIKGEENNYA